MAAYLFSFWSLLFLAALPAVAQSDSEVADHFELSAFGGVSWFGSVNQNAFSEKLVTGGMVGAGSGYNFAEHFSLEGDYSYAVNNARFSVATRTGTFNSVFGNRVHSIAVNPVFYFTRRGARLRPFLTAGIGPSWFAPTKEARAVLPIASRATELAFNYGGGVKYYWGEHFGLRLDARAVLERNPSLGLPGVPNLLENGVEATAGLIYAFGRVEPATASSAAQMPAPVIALQPLNAGEITGGAGQLCQGRAFTLHATVTDPAGHALAYRWRANGVPLATNDPDLSYKPNNAGDFAFEVEVSDASDPKRSLRIGPKTFVVADYARPNISGLTASPNLVNLGDDSKPQQNVILAADVTTNACNGNLTYKWMVSEGSLSKAAGPSAVFDTASLNFDSGQGQTKTISATLTATDEAGNSVAKSVSFVADYPAQYKRLPDVVFAKNSARVNNCGKRILVEQAAPQAGTAFDILLVGHRSDDEVESVPTLGQRSLHSSTLDRQRLFSVAAVLSGDHGTCGNLDLSQIRISAAGTEQISSADPGLCGTSTTPETLERAGAGVSELDKERRVEVYLVPKGSQTLPPAARNGVLVSTVSVKALGCPK